LTNVTTKQAQLLTGVTGAVTVALAVANFFVVAELAKPMLPLPEAARRIDAL